jgi:hypothetical protein
LIAKEFHQDFIKYFWLFTCTHIFQNLKIMWQITNLKCLSCV